MNTGYQCMVAGCSADHVSKREVCGSQANVAHNVELLSSKQGLSDSRLLEVRASAQPLIESGVATDMGAICPLLLTSLCTELIELREDNRRYESGRVVLTGEIDTLKQKLAYAEDAAAKGDLARQNTAGMDLLIDTQRDKIQELEKKLSARLQQIEELRMAERHNVHTVAELQQERDRLQRENQALRNLANNLRPGPISEALAGSMDEDYRRAGLPPNDALELSKSAVASIDWLRRKCGHDSKTVYGCEYCAAADLIESQSSTIFHISRAGDDLRRQITERDALTKSDPFANAPLTGPGSRLEADLREIRKRAVPDETLSGSKPELPDETDDRQWLIRKRGYYYRPNRAGYTANVAEAGRYTETEAKAEAAIEPAIMQAVPLQTALSETDG